MFFLPKQLLVKMNSRLRTYFTLAYIVLLCCLTFGLNKLTAQSYINEPIVSFDVSENNKLIQFECISKLSNTEVQEISNLFTRFIGVDSITYCDTTMVLSVSCVPLIQPKDLKPLFTMLNIVVVNPEMNVDEIQKKVFK